MKKEIIEHIDLSKIKDPSFLKGMSYPSLNALSQDIRSYILDITSKYGGHLSSNLGVVEATIGICKALDFNKDKIIFDVGHQCYTYKILTGRNLENLRCKDGPSGFQKMDESSFDHYEAGHSSTSISAAEGMAIARDLNNEKYEIVAFIGDASLMNGLSMEAINFNCSLKHKIIIVVNDNEMSISPSVGGIARLFRKFSTSSFYRRSKNFYKKIMYKTKVGKKIYDGTAAIKNWFKRVLIKVTIFDYLDYSVIGPIDGHNIKAVEKAMLRAKKNDKSTIVYLKTVKGKGYTPAEEDERGFWHGISGFDKDNGIINNPSSNLISWSEIYSLEVLKAMRCNDKIITLVAATGFGSYMNPVFKEFPRRTLDVGIAEEHAVTMSSGLAVSSYHPIISMYSTFLQRAYDQINHDIARMNLNSTFLIDRAGLVGNDGETHQGIFDEEFLIGMPNTTVCMASRKEEAFYLMQESINGHGPFFIRYPRDFVSIKSQDATSIEYGKWIKELSGDKTAIVSVGPVTIELKNKLIELNKNITLINAIYQKPMDEQLINELLKYEEILIYDIYGTSEGFASYLATRLISLNYKGSIKIKAIPSQFIKQATINEQIQDLGLTINDLIALLP